MDGMTEARVTEANVTEANVTEANAAGEKMKENGTGTGTEGKKAAPVPDWRKGRLEVLTDRFPLFIGLALGFGILYTFCMYKNPFGITYPLMAVCGYGILGIMLPLLSVRIKRDSWFLAAVAVLLGISTCLTADPLLVHFNKTAEFLLAVVFIVHQFYEDRRWSVGKYLSAMAVYLCGVIASVVYPFCQGSYFLKKVNLKKYKSVMRFLLGIAAAMPIMLAVGMLLVQADAVFQSIMGDWLSALFDFQAIVIMVSMTVFGTLVIYCLVNGACLDLVSKEEKSVKKHEPVAAIACMSLVAVLYLFFSGIQVVYLFLGRGSLPYGMTYSSYARQGFFQLLAVAVMNLIMVLVNLKFFMKSRFLNLILTVVCGCTYVMIASAIYRMVLYVSEYHLTYLRVLVLWFLALLACMMAGVAVMIYRNLFPLFRWWVAVISVFYVGFSFVRPERVIAEYNVKYVKEWTESDYMYMTRALSADAVPAVLEALEKEAMAAENKEEEWERFLHGYRLRKVSDKYQVKCDDFRTVNFSFEAAEKAFHNAGLE